MYTRIRNFSTSQTKRPEIPPNQNSYNLFAFALLMTAMKWLAIAYIQVEDEVSVYVFASKYVVSNWTNMALATLCQFMPVSVCPMQKPHNCLSFGSPNLGRNHLPNDRYAFAACIFHFHWPNDQPNHSMWHTSCQFVYSVNSWKPCSL